MIQIKETRNFVTRNFPLVWGRELREPTILAEGEFSARRFAPASGIPQQLGENTMIRHACQDCALTIANGEPHPRPNDFHGTWVLVTQEPEFLDWVRCGVCDTDLPGDFWEVTPA